MSGSLKEMFPYLSLIIQTTFGSKVLSAVWLDVDVYTSDLIETT